MEGPVASFKYIYMKIEYVRDNQVTDHPLSTWKVVLVWAIHKHRIFGSFCFGI